MPFPKMSVFQNMKDLILKGPSGLVNARMSEHQASMDEMMNLDRSDPEAMRQYTAKKNAEINSTLGSSFVKVLISEKNMAHIESIQNQAINDQAEFHTMLKEKRMEKAASAPSAPDQAAADFDEK